VPNVTVDPTGALNTASYVLPAGFPVPFEDPLMAGRMTANTSAAPPTKAASAIKMPMSALLDFCVAAAGAAVGGAA